MTSLRMSCVAVSLLVLGGMPATAEPKRADLPHIDHAVASLEVIGSEGQSADYSSTQLQEFPTYEVETRTPCRAQSAAFTFLATTEFRRSAESILIVQDEIQRH